MFETPVNQKKSSFLKHLAGLDKSKVNLVVLHLAEATPEMNALIDMNSSDMQAKAGEPIVAMHRAAELAMLLSKEFQGMVKSKKVELVTYRDLMNTVGVEGMRSPVAR